MATNSVTTMHRYPTITGRSSTLIESIRSFPIPGHANIDSVTTANAITEPNSTPAPVTTGTSTFLSTRTPTTRGSVRPLARAQRTRARRLDPRVPERRRHALEDQADRRHVEGEGSPEVPGCGVPDEDEILLEERPVEAQRGGGARDLVLVGLRVDEDVHRVSDGVYTGKHEQRHHRKHAETLQHAVNDVGK